MWFKTWRVKYGGRDGSHLDFDRFHFLLEIGQSVWSEENGGKWRITIWNVRREVDDRVEPAHNFRRQMLKDPRMCEDTNERQSFIRIELQQVFN